MSGDEAAVPADHRRGFQQFNRLWRDIKGVSALVGVEVVLERDDCLGQQRIAAGPAVGTQRIFSRLVTARADGQPS